MYLYNIVAYAAAFHVVLLCRQCSTAYYDCFVSHIAYCSYIIAEKERYKLTLLVIVRASILLALLCYLTKFYQREVNRIN